jgi:colanic acid/amylovoran biosynthesis glycosyltransferase
MKKVLHYKTNYLNSSETFIDRLVRNHKIFRPAILCYRKKEFTEDLPLFAVPTGSIASFTNTVSFHLNLPLPYYYKAVQRYQPDVIHSHFGFDGVKMMQIAKSLNIPHIISFYGSDVSRLPNEFGWKRRYRKLAEQGSRFIAATSFMKEQLTELGFPDRKISVVRFGVNLINSDLKPEYSISPKLMMVGRMVEKKGFEYAIRAVKILRERGTQVELNLYGNGPLMNSLKSLTDKLYLNGQVIFHGYQPVNAILDAHNSHSMLLAPSVTAMDGDMEGLPNTILEAMAKGTLVIATRHAAIPEVIKDRSSGYLVDERDSTAIADAVLSILNNESDLNQIRKNARSIVENTYCVDRMVDELETIYNHELIKKNG